MQTTTTPKPVMKKKITVRSAGPVRLTAAAASMYGSCWPWPTWP